MSESLSGRIALVTGSAKRIGRAIALALGHEGADVVVHYHSSEDEALQLCGELVDIGVNAWAIDANLGNPEEAESLVSRVLEITGGLDILINNASVFPGEKLDELSLESLESNIRINAWAPFVLSRGFRRLIGRGKIVNLLDTRITGYDWAHTGYILSKHVLALITKMTAVDYAPDITVNAVCPGLILPPPGRDDSYLERLTGTVPLKRHGSPEDIADAVIFLLKSTFCTGEVIYVDGGRHLRE